MKDLEKQLETSRKIDSLHNDALVESFKGIMLDGCGQSGPNFHAHMHKANCYFVNSDYYYKGNLEFFHLTSINNLWSILNSRAFRLYNLHSSKDREEYSYAAKILELSERQIDFGKKYTYTFSICPISELTNDLIWQTYGDNYKGAAIVFEIEDDPLDWINYHIAEVKYDEPDSFKSYRKSAKEIESQYTGINLSCDLSQLICFHKTSRWEGEKEVRIATYYPFNNVEQYWKYSKSEFRLETGRNRVTNYIEMPIWVDNNSSWVKSYDSPELDRTQNLNIDYFNTRPKIKIKDILIGKNSGIQIEEFDEFRSLLVETIRYNFGYDLDISYNFFSV